MSLRMAMMVLSVLVYSSSACWYCSMVLFRVRRVSPAFGGKVRAQAVKAGNGRVQLLACGLFRGGGGRSNISAHLIAREQELFTYFRHALVHGKTVFVTCGQLQGAVQQRRDGVLGQSGAAVHVGTGCGGLDVSLAHAHQCTLVAADDGLLLLEQLEVFRALEGGNQLTLLRRKRVNAGLYTLCGSFVAIRSALTRFLHNKVS